MRYFFIFLLIVGLSNSGFAKTDISIHLSLNNPDTICKGAWLGVSLKNNGNHAVTNTPVRFHLEGDSGAVIDRYDTIDHIYGGSSRSSGWSFYPDKSGRYKVTVFHLRTDDSIVSNDTLSFYVFVRPGPIIKSFPKETYICKGDSAYLEFTTNATMIEWYDLRYPLTRPPVSKTNKYYFKPIGSISKVYVHKYLVIVADPTPGQKCHFKDTVTLYVLPSPTLNLYQPEPVLCGKDSFVVIGDTCSNCKYLWSTGDTTARITVWRADVYWIKVTDTLIGCGNFYYVFVDSPALYLDSHRYVCEGETVNFNSGYYKADTYLWDFGDQSQSTLSSASHTYSTPGRYIVKLSVTQGQCSIQASQIIDVVEKVKGNYTITGHCTNEPVRFQASVDSAHESGVTYIWDVGGSVYTSADFTRYFADGTYKATLTTINHNACRVSEEIAFKVYSPPVAYFLIKDSVLTAGGGYNYQWFLNDVKMPDVTEQVYTAKVPGYYRVSYESAIGCRDISDANYVYRDTTSGIAPSFLPYISISPNPGRGTFCISWHGDSPEKIVVTDVVGREIFVSELHHTESRFVLDLHNQPSGYYLVRLERGGIVNQAKIMKL